MLKCRQVLCQGMTSQAAGETRACMQIIPYRRPPGRLSRGPPRPRTLSLPPAIRRTKKESNQKSRKRQGTTSQTAEKLARSLRKRKQTASPVEEKLRRSLKKRQGTTSDVPQVEKARGRALAPEGCYSGPLPSTSLFPQPVQPCRKWPRESALAPAGMTARNHDLSTTSKNLCCCSPDFPTTKEESQCALTSKTRIVPPLS